MTNGSRVTIEIVGGVGRLARRLQSVSEREERGEKEKGGLASYCEFVKQVVRVCVRLLESLRHNGGARVM